MALMFTATTNIKKAVELINQLDGTKFPLLLSRIVQKLHLKDERSFSEVEEGKLQAALDLSAQQLQLVLHANEFFLQQAAYHTAKPAVLSQQLSQLQLDDDKVQMIVDAWTTGAKSVIEKLRHRSLAPKQLEDINWQLHLQMAQASSSKLKQPTAMFELGVRDEEKQVKEKIQMEFTHEELYAFYNKLETIQTQIDSLS